MHFPFNFLQNNTKPHGHLLIYTIVIHRLLVIFQQFPLTAKSNGQDFVKLISEFLSDCSLLSFQYFSKSILSISETKAHACTHTSDVISLSEFSCQDLRLVIKATDNAITHQWSSFSVAIFIVVVCFMALKIMQEVCLCLLRLIFEITELALEEIRPFLFKLSQACCLSRLQVWPSFLSVTRKFIDFSD